MIRKLKTSDLFSLSRIIKKMNIKDEIKGLAKDVTGATPEEKKKAEQSMEIDLAMLFVENIGSAEKEIYKFFADITGKTAADIENMDLNDFINLVKELFNQDGFASFLSTASK
jgi:hypothetical protein